MSTSNVPVLTITPEGVSVPETPEILAGALKDLNTAFGGNLNTTNVGTPQGVLAAEITAAVAEAYAAMANLMAMVDPASSEGRFQDAIARIYFITRKAATPTVVECLCTGAPGVTLPAGSLAEDDDGYTYQSLSDVIFDTSGQATANFQCQTYGPIPVGIGGITKIAQIVPSWDAITNLVAGVPGVSQENRTDFEARRSASVSGNAHGSTVSIFSAVDSIADVTDCYVAENTSNAVINVGATNYPLTPHSVYVAVVGGLDEDVAYAIWSKKATGCDYNGNTTVTIEDVSGFSTPYPAYSVKFERPTALDCKVAISITNTSRLPFDIIAQTKAAVMAAWNGTDGGDRARIASDIYASRFYAGVASISPFVQIVSVQIGVALANALTINVGVDQVPTLSESNIVVTLV